MFYTNSNLAFEQSRSYCSGNHGNNCIINTCTLKAQQNAFLYAKKYTSDLSRGFQPSLSEAQVTNHLWICLYRWRHIYAILAHLFNALPVCQGCFH